jgi:hypothetical protein
VRSAEVSRSEAAPSNAVPERGQVGGNDSESGSKETWDVLHDDDSRSKNANGASELMPEPGAVADNKPSTKPSVAEILAGKPAGEHIDMRESGVDLSHVFGNRDGRPVALEDASGVGVVLAGPDRLESCVVEAEVESPASAEERSCGSIHRSPSLTSLARSCSFLFSLVLNP